MAMVLDNLPYNATANDYVIRSSNMRSREKEGIKAIS